MAKQKVITSMFLLILVGASIIVLFQIPKDDLFSNDPFTFNGFVVDKIDDGSYYKVLVVNNITESQAIEWDTIDVMGNYINSEDVAFFIIEEQDYQKVDHGDQVLVTWDSNGVFQQAKYPTLVATKVEVIK